MNIVEIGNIVITKVDIVKLVFALFSLTFSIIALVTVIVKNRR
jgi:hypothetical protein